MLKQLSIRIRLLGGFACAIILSGIIILLSISTLRGVAGRYDEVLDDYVTVVNDIKDARIHANAIARYLRDMALNPDTSGYASTSASIQSLETSLNDALQTVENGYTASDGLDTQYVTAVRSWLTVAKEIQQQLLSGDRNGATTRIISECTPALDNVATLAQQATTSLQKMESDAIQATSRYADLARYVIIGLLVVGATLLIILSIAITKSIIRPLDEVKEVIVAMSKGDLKMPCKYESPDEVGITADALRSSQATLSGIITTLDDTLGRVAAGDFTATLNSRFPGDLENIERSLNHLLKQLNEVMGQLRTAGDQVSSGADQVSSGAQALAQGATEQASSVEELSATIASISVASKQNAQTAIHARDLGNQAGTAIGQCNARMQDMLSAMEDISTSSDRISKIIKSIEDIAFQTNILALNAAVEAARAGGSAGKGFSVVADEVRQLAGKSAAASKDTATLIEQSLKAVERGSTIATETAQSLGEASQLAQGAVESIEEIAAASEQEADSIEQITIGIDQISAVVQTNSATSEESAAASEELSGQAQMMHNLLGRFRLGGGIGMDTGYAPAPAQEYTPASGYDDFNSVSDKY